jgi:hypothetical protein
LDDKPCIIAPDFTTSDLSEYDPESVGTSKESVRSWGFYLEGVLSTESPANVNDNILCLDILKRYVKLEYESPDAKKRRVIANLSLEEVAFL